MELLYQPPIGSERYDFFAEVLASSNSTPAGTFNALAILSRMTTVGLRTPRSMPLM